MKYLPIQLVDASQRARVSGEISSSSSSGGDLQRRREAAAFLLMAL
jgi:hypothetical protein